MIISKTNYLKTMEKLRFDAEYYMPKFLETEALLQTKHAIALGKIAKFSRKRIKPCDEPDKSFRYIDISNINVVTGEITPQVLMGHQAPSRARKLVETNDIILSTVRPNRNAVAIISNFRYLKALNLIRARLSTTIATVPIILTFGHHIQNGAPKIYAIQILNVGSEPLMRA